MTKLYYKGPNFTADIVLTRDDPDTGNLELLVIKRKDTGELAFPGGFIDKDEEPFQAALRELKEEAGVELNGDGFSKVYEGKTGDPRDTKDSWIETTAFYKHVSSEENLKIKHGDDADDVLWIEVTEANLDKMYANHGEITKKLLLCSR